MAPTIATQITSTRTKASPHSRPVSNRLRAAT